MKDSRNMGKRLLALLFLITATSTLTGCSTVWDGITWGPKKIWSATGDKWLGVKQQEQPTLKELGPKRPPIDNPVNGVLMEKGKPITQKAPYAAPISQFSMQPPSQSGDMPTDPMDAAAANEARAMYESGGKINNSNKKSWFSWPWSSSSNPNYKLEVRFEPLAAELTISEKDLKKEKKKKQNRSASMFPLEQFAPQAAVTATQQTSNSDTYPKLGKTPDLPQNRTSPESAAETMDKLMKESAELEKKRQGLTKHAPSENIEAINSNTQNIKTPENNATNNATLSNYSPTISPSDTSIKAEKLPPQPEVSQAQKPSVIKTFEAAKADNNVPANTPIDMNAKAESTPADKGTSQKPKIFEANRTDKDLPINDTSPNLIAKTEKTSNNSEEVKTPAAPPAPVAKSALKNDASIIAKIPTDTAKTTDTKEKTPGFFSRMFGGNKEKNPVRTWGQAEPNSTGAEDVVEQNLPSVNMPDDAAPSNINQRPSDNPPVPNVQFGTHSSDFGKKYEPTDGRFLPESRYTGRRKVPQTDK